jgi:hypothetical protein
MSMANSLDDLNLPSNDILEAQVHQYILYTMHSIHIRVLAANVQIILMSVSQQVCSTLVSRSTD